MDIQNFGTTKSYLAPQLEARSHPDKGGNGVFARESVSESTLLAVWTGVVIDEEQLETVPPHIRAYVAQIEETLYLVSLPPIEPADYINHSCQPNAGMSGQIGIVALRDIEPGEEICIDYAMCDGSPYDEFRCSCETPGCRGHVTGNDWMLAELQERYHGYFSPYLQRRIDWQRESLGVADEPLEFTLHAITFGSELMDQAQRIIDAGWPEFMLHDAVANEHWFDLYRKFPDYQFALMTRTGGKIIGIGNSVPLTWHDDLANLPDEGWDWALQRAVADWETWDAPRIQCALSITLAPEFRGKGYSSQMVQAMKSLGGAHGFDYLIAPVRPSMKQQYPLVRMESYARWRNPDGLPFDPWLRLHARLGAEIIKVCHRSMHISGAISDWERWTGLTFHDQGAYPIPGGLVPVEIDPSNDRGVYVEPNVWMAHSIWNAE